MENDHLWWIYPLNMVMFQFAFCKRLPEGSLVFNGWFIMENTMVPWNRWDGLGGANCGVGQQPQHLRCVGFTDVLNLGHPMEHKQKTAPWGNKMHTNWMKVGASPDCPAIANSDCSLLLLGCCRSVCVMWPCSSQCPGPRCEDSVQLFRYNC